MLLYTTGENKLIFTLAMPLTTEISNGTQTTVKIIYLCISQHTEKTQNQSELLVFPKNYKTAPKMINAKVLLSNENNYKFYKSKNQARSFR